ncbi:MAG: hypothetical protein ACYDCK_04440 [Thermoplasmatota archaeon]
MAARPRAALALILLATLPMFGIGVYAFSGTVARALDPCTTWGTSWSSYQEGGGTSQPTPGCPNGSQRTTESRTRAIVLGATLPLLGGVALVCGSVGWVRGNPLVVLFAAPALLVEALPLSLGYEVLVAYLPVAALVGGARLVAPLDASARAAMRAFGAIVAAFAVFGIVNIAIGFSATGANVIVLAASLWVVACLGLTVASCWWAAPSQRGETRR